METPVLFLIFNRPDKTKVVFEKIKEAKPKFLYVAADGPRNIEESKICNETRSLVIDQIDWPCEVKTLFRENNLGCTNAVVSAIDWFFEHVEKGIILEDDCLPELSFFDFCSKLLEKYVFEDRIKHISGSNFMHGKKYGEGSYYFSYISFCWGWATWRRAWQQYRLNRVEEISDQQYLETLNYPSFSPRHKQYWKWLFDYHRKSEDNIWDHRWNFNIWFQKGLAITPNVNLITNIGYGIDATTSKGANETRNKLSNLKTQPLTEIKYLNEISVNLKADEITCQIYNPPLPLLKSIRHEIGKIVPSAIRLHFRKVFP